MKIEVTKGQLTPASFRVKAANQDAWLHAIMCAHYGQEAADAMNAQEILDSYLNLLNTVSREWVQGWRAEQARTDAVDALPDPADDFE